MSGKSINDPKIYISGLSKEEKEKLFPEGTFVKTKNGKIHIMKNNKPVFTNTTNVSLKRSVCYGKKSIEECPVKDCIWHNKSKQCRLKKYSSPKSIELDKRLRANGNTGKIDNKLLLLLKNFIDSYNGEPEKDYIKKIIKKLNNILDKYNNNYSASFSAS